MKEKDETIKLDHYINLIFKHRWLIIIPFCLAVVVGIYLAITLPKIYEASTLILVEPQEVPTNFVRSIVTADIRSRISTISQQIMSRTNLERIIGKFGLFSDPELTGMYMEDKLEGLRKRIEVKVTRTGGPDTFYVSYRGTDPKTVMLIANDLAGAFIEENLKVRETKAVGTSKFLETQLQATREQLEQVEDKLRSYRKRYMGELPEQLEANQKAIDRLQDQLNETRKSIRDSKNRLILIDNRIDASRTQQAIPVDTGKKSGALKPLNLQQLKAQLEELSSKYTDQHPDVIRLKQRIKELEAKERESQDTFARQSDSEISNSQSRSAINPNMADIMQQRQAILLEIANRESEIPRIENQIKIYQQRVENTPKREEELLGLKRDYNNIQESYNSLLNRKLEAGIALNMEKKQKGEQFRIIDQAKLPRKPVFPDLRKLFLMTLAVGLGIGAGFIFLLDFFNTSLKDPDKFEEELGVAVLATIPKVYQRKDISLKRLNQLLTAVSIVVAVGLTAGFAVLVVKGVEPTIEAVRPYLAFLKI
jgi:polysaccharide chain length determinant protein (PEP-CTERM system associated)